MDANTPITLAATRHSDRGAAVNDLHTIWDARHEGDFDHMAVAVPYQGRRREPQGGPA
jgi:hypothetical protein